MPEGHPASISITLESGVLEKAINFIGDCPLLPPVIPGRDPGLGLFPEVLVLEARGIHFHYFVERSETINK